MESTRWEQMQSIFHQALERSPSEREAWVAAACAGDIQLAGEILAMLAVDVRTEALLEGGMSGLAAHLIEDAGDFVREIGPYRLVRLLGEGGMGVVWLAEREDTGSRVAIKFLPHSGLSPSRRERFALEIKTLAKLQHPFIARLYDAGTLGDGMPWFVMEYVEGETLQDYVLHHSPSLDERLRIFREICEAAGYAHSRGVIHRDLKPSNILIDKSGQPRLLDFGIARELQESDDLSERTRPGMRFLSPDYAAPEWVRDGTVGFSTDVYSLGVVLYELLTGTLPFARERTSGVHGEPSRVLQPERPSLSGRSAFSLSKAGWSELDVLCLKAMHRDPAQRYVSIEALLRDLNHYCNQEPLEARPDSFRYRLEKFVARNRRPVLVTSAATALVFGMLAFFTMGLAKARNSAVAEADRTQRIRDFMDNLFQGGDSLAGPADDLRVVTLLDRGVQEAQGLAREPAVQAEVYRTLGISYYRLGKFDQAERLLDSALHIDRSLPHSDLAISDDLIAKAQLLSDRGKFKAAQELSAESLGVLRQQRPRDFEREARANSAKGKILTDAGEFASGAEALQEAVTLQQQQSPNSPDLLETLLRLGDAQFYLGHYDLSEATNLRALAIAQSLHGQNHPSVAQIMANLGDIDDMRGNYQLEEKHNRQALAASRAWYGSNHPETARRMAHLGSGLIKEEQYDQAEVMLREALAIETRVYGEDHPFIATILNSLASIDSHRGNFEETEKYRRRVLRIYTGAYGENDYRVGVALANLGSFFLRQKQYANAEPFFRQALAVMRKTQPPDNINIGVSELKLGRTILRQGRFQEAEPHTRLSYEILSKQMNPQTDYVLATRSDLAAIYAGLKEPDKAREFQAPVSIAAAGNTPPAGAAR